MNPEDIAENQKNNKKQKDEKQKTFLFVQIIGLGDIIVASQACQDIKRFCRNSKIIFIVPENLVEAAQGIKEVDEVYGFDKHGRHKGFWGMLKFLTEFKHKGRIDYSFTTFGADRALMLATLLRAKEKHTYRPTDFMLKFEKFLNMKIHLVDESTNSAEDLQNWVASIFNEIPCSRTLDFTYPKEYDKEILKKLTALKASNYPLIALCPCSSESKKDWTPKNAAQLIECCYPDGRRVVFVGQDKDKWFVDEVKKLTKRPFFNLMGETDIFEIAALAKKSQVFLSVDTGPMHVAYACGAPTVCMFFSSPDFYKWAPKEYKNTAVLHRPEGISGEKCYEIIKDFLKQQTEDEDN